MTRLLVDQNEEIEDWLIAQTKARKNRDFGLDDLHWLNVEGLSGTTNVCLEFIASCFMFVSSLPFVVWRTCCTNEALQKGGVHIRLHMTETYEDWKFAIFCYTCLVHAIFGIL